MKTLVFDLDGTMYRGTAVIESAKIFLEACMEHQVPFLFLTNNSMRTRQQNVDHMYAMGYTNLTSSMFYNSAMAACQYAKENYQAKSAYYIGQDGLNEAMQENGIIFNDVNPEVVFVGLDKKADYMQYSKALGFLLQGARLIGTNKDHILASPTGFEIGNGSIVKMFEFASKQESPAIGKPSAWILEACLKHFGLKKEEIVMIGDNLDTDILCGVKNGVKTIFVETGVHTREDIDSHGVYPDIVVHSLIDFLNDGCYNR